MTYSIYVFLDNKNRPYYVGKTNNMSRRKKEHLAEIKNGNTLPKYAKARKLIRAGIKFRMRVIRTTNNEDQAYKLEKHFIKRYRSEGYQLFNCTFGGPEEIPMRINKPNKINRKGISLPAKSKNKTKVRKKNSLTKRI